MTQPAPILFPDMPAPRANTAFTVGCLGQPSDHLTTLDHLLASAGLGSCPMPDSCTAGVYGPDNAPVFRRLAQKTLRLRNQWFGTRNPRYVRALLDAIDQQQVRCVLATWGTWILGDVAAIKRHRPHLPVLLNVLCHPTALTPAKITLQNRYFRRMARYLDGLLVPSHAMQRYLQEHVLGSRSIPCQVCPPHYAGAYFPATRRPPCETSPNILFLGRMDVARAQPCDNVISFLDTLLDCGVHVYHSQSSHAPSAAQIKPHPFRHTFPYMPLAEAMTFATAFDASLIMYNLDACPRTDRFDLTVPDRLLASVAAGVPIAIPNRGYAAPREYLQDYRALIPFASASDLATQLRDRATITQLRQIAQYNAALFRGERHVQPLATFLRRFVTV